MAAMTFRALLAVSGVLLVAAQSHAGSISITTRQNAHYDAGNLVLNVTIGNTGDEAAQAVTPILRFGGKEARGKRVESLAPNQTVQDTVTLPVGELTSGTWIYLVAVDYTDTNQYPFQAVQGGRVAIGNPAPPKVSVASLVAGRLAKTASGTLTVKNLEGVARTVSVRLMPPDGIEVSPVTSEVALEPWGEKALDLEFTNRTALAGSRYPVFAAVEYDAEGNHFGVLGQGTVEITPSETVVDRFGGSLWIGAAALGVLFVVLVGLRARRG
jgi:hypothetical protein